MPDETRSTTNCPPEAAFADLVEGRLTGEPLAHLLRHVRGCSACHALFDAVASRETLRVSSGGLAPPREGLERGTSIGRFLVLSLLGRGGMGAVYAAYDPELDRRVALKLLHAARGSEQARRRLIREARALGKLSHPNVVQVYDVGEHEGDVFVAMELVDGQSFDVWCRSDPAPGWQAVLSAYLDAARGLSAAHEKGLVHRDVKPSNILRGKDGRVRVVDFGIAAGGAGPWQEGLKTTREVGTAAFPDSETIPVDETMPATTGPEQPTDERLTMTGTILGTPLYMAPEQYDGPQVTPASDQYSLCTALYEGLYGVPPFVVEGGVGLNQLFSILAQKKGGAPATAPADTAVPAWIHRALVRGLAPMPEDRHASLDALIAALSEDPAARRSSRWRGVGIAAAIAGLLGLAAVGWSRSGAPPDPCAHPEQQLAGRWDAGVAGQVRAAFLGTSRPYAADTSARVAAALDDYSASWVAMRGEVCRATLRKDQRAEVLALRDACLERRRGQLQALTTLFAEKPDPQVLDRAVSAATSLAPLAYCADTEALVARVPPPEDPALRARVASLQAQVDQMMALHSAGRYQQGLDLGQPLLAQAEALGFPPLRAQVQVGMGRLREASGDYAAATELLRAGAISAAEGRDDVLAGQAVAWLLLIVGFRQQRFDEAAPLEAIGKVVVARARDEATQATWLNSEGLVFDHMRRFTEAEAAYDRSLAIGEKLFGRDSPTVARTRENLAALFERKGDLPRAKVEFERALSGLEAALGPDHPDVASAQYDMAILLDDMGELPQAVALHERALASREKALGPDHPNVAASLTNLAVVLLEMGDLPRAQALFERALAIKEKTLSPHHAALAVTMDNLGLVAYALGEYPKAKLLFERSISIWEQAYGHDHPDIAYGLFGLGRTLVRLGKSDEALPLLERALALREKAQGTSHRDVSEPLLGLGDLYLARGKPERAAPLLERALALDTVNPEPELLLALAEALWQLRVDRPRARSLAERCRARYERVGHRTGVAATTRWLAEHPLPQ